MNPTSALCVICVTLLSVAVDAKSILPSFITQCSRTNIEPCILKNAEAIKPYLSKGIGRLGLTATSPHVVPQIKVATGKFSLEANDITSKNIGNFILKQFKLDLEKNSLIMEVHFPKLEPIGDYIMNGSILGIDMNTEGKGLGILSNVHITTHFSGEQILKNGKLHLSFTDKKVKVTHLDDIYMYLYSLSEETNEFINANIRPFVAGMGPVIETYVGSILEAAVKNIFEKHALEDLFID